MIYWEGLIAEINQCGGIDSDFAERIIAALRPRERDRRVIEAAKKMAEDIARLADHHIPSYAWGDNEAAVDMDNRLGTILHTLAEFNKALK